MKNEDLKRFFEDNKCIVDSDDFVRYNKNKTITVADAHLSTDAVNLKTMKENLGKDGEGNNIAETYQTKSNLVTAWGVPTDDKYPSAKLVKTTIDGIISGEGSTSFVFNTEADFNKWIAGTIETDINGKTKADLIIGSTVLIKEENVPDYWCSSISDPLTKADFTPYEAKINLDNYLAKNNTEEFIPTGDYNPSTKKYVDDKVLENIGVENLLGFDGVLENNVITFTADETLADFTLKNNTRYNIDLRLPLTTLTGDLDNSYTMVLNFNGTSININNILVQDPTQTATVGSMCALQNYEPETGYSWRFNALYTSYTEGNTVVNSVYTEDITRETNPSMTGNDFAIAVADSKLKVGTTIMVTTDFTNNGTTYKAGHTYLITGEWSSGALMLTATDITPKEELYFERLIGTTEHPINFAKDMEYGKAYICSGEYDIINNITSGIGASAQTIRIQTSPMLTLRYDPYTPDYGCVFLFGANLSEYAGGSLLQISPSYYGFVRISYNLETGAFTKIEYGMLLKKINGLNVNITAQNGIYAPVESGTAGQILKSGGENNPPVWSNAQHTQQIIYDNTTLGEHITEILGYVNNENGGTLINLGFKIGETAVTGERKTVTLNTTDNTISNTTDTNTIIGAGEFVYATPAVMGVSNSQKEITFLLATERDNYTSANLDLSAIGGSSAKISGQKFGYLPNSIVTIYFQEIDILNINLEHLVLNVME